MRSDSAAMRALLLVQLISMGAMEMSGPFWPLHIQSLLRPDQFQYSGLLSALVYAGPMFAAMIVTPLWGRLGDRTGHKPMMVRALVALAACQWFAGVLSDPWALISTRSAQGALAGFLAAAQAYAMSFRLEQGRGRILAKLQSATAIGALAGPVMGGWLMETYGFAWVCHSSAAICMSCALICLRLPATSGLVVPRSSKQSLVLPHGWLCALMLIIVFIQAAKAMQQPFYSLYVTQVLHATPMWVGASYAVSAVSLALSAPLWARHFDRWHPPRTLGVIEWVTWGCAATLAVAALADEWITFVISRLIWGIWQGALLPVAYALIANTLPPSRHGLALGLGTSAAKAGGLCGVFIGGIGMSVVGVAHSFWLVVIAYLVAALTLRLIRSVQFTPALNPSLPIPEKTQQ